MLTELQDGYGREVYAHQHGERGFEVVERDDGYVDLSGGPAPYFAPFEEWPLRQQRAVEFVAGRVLDVGAGAGRVALYLQEKGHDVLAIDNSPLAVEICRRRGVKSAAILPITQVSSKLGTFDTIVMMGNNFGLFGGFKRARWLLKRFRAITSPKARIIAESNDPYQTDNPDHLAYQEMNRKRGRMSGQLRLRIRYRRYATPWFDYLLVSRDEMREILAGTGWHASRFIDDGGSGYVAVIEKD